MGSWPTRACRACAIPRASESPRADVGIIAFTAGRAIRTETENVDFTAHTWIQILIWIAPRVSRKSLDIPACLPVSRNRLGRRLCDKRLQTLLGGRVTLIVQAVEPQSLHERRDILFRCDDARFVGPADDTRN